MCMYLCMHVCVCVRVYANRKVSVYDSYDVQHRSPRRRLFARKDTGLLCIYTRLFCTNVGSLACSTGRHEDVFFSKRHGDTLHGYSALLHRYRALLHTQRALWQRYRALLHTQRALLQRSMAPPQRHRIPLHRYAALLHK